MGRSLQLTDEEVRERFARAFPNHQSTAAISGDGRRLAVVVLGAGGRRLFESDILINDCRDPVALEVLVEAAQQIVAEKARAGDERPSAIATYKAVRDWRVVMLALAIAVVAVGVATWRLTLP